ncbi:HAMP domain-containing sensor histidine kinase [Clostridium intestinale]|uniref:histidine kinase n=1 Tax=Clostridium intestinale URNW TaxID=1294142 RepID=U2NL54_9CLOT|nr:HAMP domain-containing sensor histidine kinase [Clostridium intestinale]ERK29576.1 sensory transduction protein kinase [Clostridium intestinale URNW]
MAIKLKGSRKVGVICIILFISSILIGGYAILDIKFNGYYLDKDNYTETIEFKNIMSEYVEAVTKSYIRYGESKNSDKFNEVTENDLKAKRTEYEEKYTQGKANLNQALSNGYISENSSDENSSSYYSLPDVGNVIGYFDGLDKLEATYKVDDENLKRVILDERRVQYNSYENCIEQYKNLQYVLYENNNVVKTNIEKEYINDDNLKELIYSSKSYLILDGTKLGNLFQNVEGTFPPDYFIYNTKSYEDIKNYKLKFMLFVPKDLYYDDMIKIYSNKFTMQHDKYKKECIVIAIAAFISLISFAYILKFRKKVFIKSNNVYKEKLTYRLYKKLWLELKLILIPIDALILLMLFDGFKYMIGYSSYGERLIYLIGIFITYVISLETYRTLVKEIDEKGLKNVIKETSLLYKFYLLIKETFIIRSVGGRISIFVIATLIFIFDIMLTSLIIYANPNPVYDLAFLVMLLGGVYVFLYIGTVAYIGFKFTGSFNKIVLGAQKISQGDLNYQIEGSSIAVLDVLAKDINNMRSGLGNAIQNEVKSERMKTELITNVSHDLKTPLTSIINYVDLIKKGDFTKEEIEDYIKIIDRKSQRLKVLIEDLFEASSAASGEMELNIEKLDIVALLKQSIAEFEEKIKISKLDFRINIPNEKVYVMVDGKRTWRIFENQISNILKYSLDNTRVYINLEESEDRIIIIFKNISAYEIDFNEDEITERFKRGDQSRHTEGSGLGLAISKGLTELQDGIFKIKVDGDLFKVEIQLKKA